MSIHLTVEISLFSPPNKGMTIKACYIGTLEVCSGRDHRNIGPKIEVEV
jgi:hypothetical protein